MMRALIILAAVLALAMAIPGDLWKAPAEADKLKDPMASNPKAATMGAKVFQSLCWTCHGLEGRGDGPNASALKVRPADLGTAMVQGQSNGALYWKITHGRGEMASYEQVLSREDRWALTHHIRTLAHP